MLDRIGIVTPEVDKFQDGEDYRAFGVSRRKFGGELLIDFIAHGKTNGSEAVLVDYACCRPGHDTAFFLPLSFLRYRTKHQFMKYRFVLLLMLFSALTLIQIPEISAQSIRVDTSDRNHRFQYWGTSLAWWGNEVGGQSDAQTREELVDLFFDANNGLGMNFLRYNIGAGSNPDKSVQNITRAGAKMEGWVPDKPSDVTDRSTWQFKWNADANQRFVLDMAIQRGVKRVEAFANSAPWWMTRNESSSGAENGGVNLESDRGDDFAHYLLEVVDHFENNLGIHFETLAPMNEPGSGFWRNRSDQEGMGVPMGAGAIQDKLIKSFGDAIKDRGTRIKLVGLEETSTKQSTDSWTHPSLTDEAKSHIKQFNTHTYGFNGGSQQDNNERLYAAVTKTDGLQIFATEYGTGRGAIELAQQINRDIRYLDAADWAYWQALENNNGSGWGLTKMNFDGPNGEFDVQDQYFAFKQFSAHIRPGSEIIELQGQDNITAAYDPRTGTTALVVTNSGDDESIQRYSFKFVDQNVDSTRLIRTTDKRNRLRTNAYQSLGTASASRNRVSFESVGNSITTLLVHHRENLIENGNFDLAGAGKGASANPAWQSLGDADTDLSGVAFQLSADVRFQSSGKRQHDANTYLAIEFYGADERTLVSKSLDDYQTEIKPAPGLRGRGMKGRIQGSAPNDNEFRTYVSGRFAAPESTRYVRPVIKFDNSHGASTDAMFVDNVRLQEVHPEADGREWNVGGGGDYSNDDNWLGQAAVERNTGVYFGNAIKSASDVRLTSDQTVTGATFFSEYHYDLTGSGRLRIGDPSSLNPGRMDVRTGAHQISVKTELLSDLDVQVLPDASLTFASGLNVDGLQLKKLGAGSVNFGSGFSLSGGMLSAYISKDATIFFGSDAVLNGDYKLLITPGQLLEVGDSFELAGYLSLNRQFNNVILPELPEGLCWDLNYGPTRLTARVIATVKDK